MIPEWRSAKGGRITNTMQDGLALVKVERM